MKRQSRKVAQGLLITTILMLSYSNCAPKQFDVAVEPSSIAPLGSATANPNETPPQSTATPRPHTPSATPTPPLTMTPTPVPAGDEVFRKSHDFSATTESRPLDIVWVIDNSSSMDTEAAHVRENFLAFMNKVEASANTKFALISQKGSTGTKVSMPRSGTNYKQIDRFVDSTNPLAIAASVICKSPVAMGSPCAHSLIANESAVRSALVSFLRTDSRKTFVFVTDDESKLKPGDFLNAFRSTYVGQTPLVYSFVGRSKSESSCIRNPGLQYASLSDQTGGGVFNICKSDWKAHFDDIASNLVSTVQRTIELPANAIGAQIISVSIEGHKLSVNDYKLFENELEISLAIASQYGLATIEVVYRPQ